MGVVNLTHNWLDQNKLKEQDGSHKQGKSLKSSIPKEGKDMKSSSIAVKMHYGVLHIYGTIFEDFKVSLPKCIVDV